MRKLLLLFTVLYCTLPVHARQQGYYTEPALDELRIEIDDLKHAIKSTQVELSILDERVQKQNASLTSVKGSLANPESSPLSQLASQMALLEKKVSSLEKTLEKAANDLRTLSISASQTLNKMQILEEGILSHEKRLDEVAKLKGTLTSISKAIGQKPSDAPSSKKSYLVKAGDSLERIARNHNTTVKVLRQINTLSNDKIVPGQELRLPDDTP